ncbi:MAG TPA: Sir2 family NAD-dependent protein deacetylase, partial [Rhodopila sp.]|nr:Sir2 family NAD-dependent protein deacetylase [Rhodopila sp.]
MQRWGMAQDPDIVSFARMLGNARRIVLFTGAGISTESGIPDFRSPGGLWTKQVPIDFSDFMRSEKARRETWRRRFEMEPILRAAQPNRGHRAVAQLIHDGNASSVITQNID